ncbi:MAG: nuclear transport factor 2 family protein [Ferrovibrio sp.]|uniref:nuclear transport factor 2 family protein n=1 Tax=Ferrovibrio sp. TaxID=1917215 RepID=UPI002606262D|nr:nuclear transport factor 2 family protein [Ferrovibrio sp.]MCW0232124.1 nuclear transport factor 2 family protein [Ferrovibrio sp.]
MTLPIDPAVAEAVVQGQLDAYNAKDIDAFMAFWAGDAQVYVHPATLLADGAAAIRARHVLRFQEPNLFGRLLQRMVVGNTVVDREVVSRTFPEGPGRVDVIAIYELVGDGSDPVPKIARAWFVMGEPVLDAEDLAENGAG